MTNDKIYSVRIAAQDYRFVVAPTLSAAVDAADLKWGQDSILSIAVVGTVDLDAADIVTETGETLQ